MRTAEETFLKTLNEHLSIGKSGSTAYVHFRQKCWLGTTIPMKTSLVVTLVLVALVVFFLWRSGKAAEPPRSVLMPESLFVVEFDDITIKVTAPNAEKHSVAWRDLTRVGIRTTDEGPTRPDVFWGLHTNSETPAIVFPGGASGENQLLRAMQSRLSGFNNDELIKAMGSTSNAYFLIWQAAQPASAK